MSEARVSKVGGATVFGEHDEQTLKQIQDVASRAEKAALLADGHVGYVMPIGGVAAYRDRVSVVGVGFDIACGNAAIRTDLTLDHLGTSEPEVRDALETLADEIADQISFGLGRKNRADDAPVDHPLFEDPAWEAVPAKERHALREKARAQLGTVGSGNHYVDIFVDEDGVLWVGVHFGSRGFGHTVASAFLALGQGRGWVARKVVSILGANEVELVHNHHNFAWRQEIDGEEHVVVRKGATPAFPGQKGFIGGSMGDEAVIVRGAVVDESRDPGTAGLQKEALFSTVHGAGRVLSRTAAAGKRHRKTGKVITPGRVTPEMMQSWLREKGVILRGGGLDESPHAYRRLPDVLAAQGGTIEVLHTLRPLIVVMAGAEEFDPYKD